MAVLANKADALAMRIAGLDLSQSGWSAPARAEALMRLGAMGLPAKRDEYWRYTDPATLIDAEAPAAAPFTYSDEKMVFTGIDRVRLVFVDGVFDPAASDDPAQAGVELSLLSAGGMLHWARDLYGVLETRGQNPVPRHLAALNTAFATDGVQIRVTGKVTKPVSLIYLHDSDRSDVMLHHCIKLEDGAELTVLENGPAAARLNTVMEVDVARGARFHHIRTQGRDHDRRAATHVFARLAANSLFKSFTLTANGRLTRNEVVLELLGDDCTAHVAGAALASCEDDAAGRP